MDLTNPRKRAARRTSINYIVPLWGSCVPGKQEPFTGCFATSVRRFGWFAEPAAQTLKIQGNVTRIRDLCSHHAGC
jgi:hypothetical protein